MNDIAAASTKILLAEDDNDMRRFLVKALQNAGFNVASFDNGLSAYNRLREEPFELLLTDIVMPEMDGITLLRWLKKRKPNIDIVVMTGYDLTRDMLMAIGDTAMECFVKPLEPVKVHAAVQHCRARIRLRDNMR